MAFPKLWGPNVPTSIVMPVNFHIFGTFFGPYEENSYRIKLFEKQKMKKGLCEGWYFFLRGCKIQFVQYTNNYVYEISP